MGHKGQWRQCYLPPPRLHAWMKKTFQASLPISNMTRYFNCQTLYFVLAWAWGKKGLKKQRQNIKMVPSRCQEFAWLERSKNGQGHIRLRHHNIEWYHDLWPENSGDGAPSCGQKTRSFPKHKLLVILQVLYDNQNSPFIQLRIWPAFMCGQYLLCQQHWKNKNCASWQHHEDTCDGN